MPKKFLIEGITDDKKVDFVITKEKNKYIVDYFKTNIKDADEAYLETFELDVKTSKEAVEEAKAYILIN